MRELIGMMMAAAVALVILNGGMPRILDAQERPYERQAAATLATVTAAAKDYIGSGGTFAALLTQAAGGNVVLTPADLVAAGALPPHFTDGSPYGQTHRVIVHRASATGLYVATVACGGDALPDHRVLRTAAQAGEFAGAVLAQDAAAANDIVGVVGTWRLPRAIFATPACPLTGARIATVLFIDQGQVISPFLHRWPVPGLGAEPQTMHADLYMGGFDIVNAGDVAATSLTLGAETLAEAQARRVNELHAGRYEGNLQVNGDLRASAFYYTSDARLKTNVVPIEGALDTLLGGDLRGVHFTWRADGRQDLGFLAQDVAKAYPDLVGVGADGMLAVKYGNLVAPMLEAMRELKVTVDLQARDIERLRSGAGYSGAGE